MAFPYTAMNDEQIADYLSELHNAVLATNRRDGAPQISPVWYLYIDGIIYIKFDRGSAKYHNIKRDPRVSLCIEGGSDDARTVTIYGTAEFVNEDDVRLKDYKWQINLRYSQSEEAAKELEYAPDSDVKDALIAITPEKTIALDYN
jgi:PPOX class probable F420-dependent enzyme